MNKPESVTTINLVGGEKGGVGKSLLSKVMLDYIKIRQLDNQIAFFEADLSNPDVGTTFFGKGRYEELEFSRDERRRSHADKLFELAMKKSVIVNLPSNIFTTVTDWMQRNRVIEVGKQKNVRVCSWFLCTGGVSSINKFKESLKTFQDAIVHVFVRNQVIFDDWSVIERDEELNRLICSNKALTMDLPRLNFSESTKVEAKQITFGQALNSPDFTILSKQRIKNFLGATYSEFDRLKLLP